MNIIWGQKVNYNGHLGKKKKIWLGWEKFLKRGRQWIIVECRHPYVKHFTLVKQNETFWLVEAGAHASFCPKHHVLEEPFNS